MLKAHKRSNEAAREKQLKSASSLHSQITLKVILLSMILPSMILHIEKVAQSFFTLKKQDGWATCPLTENAFLRILGHPSIPKDQAPHRPPEHYFKNSSANLKSCIEFRGQMCQAKIRETRSFHLLLHGRNTLSSVSLRLCESH